MTGYTVSVPQEATAASPLSVQVKTDKQTEFKTLSKDNMKIILTEGMQHRHPAGNRRRQDGAKEVQYKIKVDLQTTQTQKPAGETKPGGSRIVAEPASRCKGTAGNCIDKAAGKESSAKHSIRCKPIQCSTTGNPIG